eukprot:929586_1
MIIPVHCLILRNCYRYILIKTLNRLIYSIQIRMVINGYNINYTVCLWMAWKKRRKKNADLKLKKNKKKLKVAKKYIGRIVYVMDARDSLFRSCRVIDARSQEDAQARDIPQKWLRPVHFKEMIEEIDELEAVYKSFRQQMPGMKLAEQLVIIDIDSIRSIQALIAQCA